MSRHASQPVSTGGLPDLGELTAFLEGVFAGRVHGKALAEVGRRRNDYTTTTPTEIVACRFSDGSEEQVLCKYGVHHSESAGDHRWGGEYEASVYREVLEPLGVSVPTLYGTHTDPSEGTWLAFEYLDGSLRVSSASSLTDCRAMVEAARWCGRFHALNQPRVARGSLRGLKRYDADFYLQRVPRALEACRQHHRAPAWLGSVCRRFEEMTMDLLAPPQTVIHGEYYPQNILAQEGVIYPVDWESAAIAAGEIDLASLTEGWPAEFARRCEEEYARARWPEGAPPEFERTLAVAGLYFPLRWLGHAGAWTPERLRFLDRLQVAGERLGLIE